MSSSRTFNDATEWRTVAIYRSVGQFSFILLVDFERYLAGELDQNIPVQDGDVVFVPTIRNTPLKEFLAYMNIVNNEVGSINSTVDVLAEAYTRNYQTKFDRQTL